MKKKYTQLVPQNGIAPPVPLECHLEMLSVTLTQWCEEERLESPISRTERPSTPSAPVFAIDNIQDSFTDMSFPASISPDLVIGHTRIDATKIDNAIAHMVCYINRGGTKSMNPMCKACGLPGHSADKCCPLICFCIVQSLAVQHPEVIRKIKAAYKQFPRNAQSHTPHKATVKQIVAFLYLPTTEDMPVLDEPEAPDVSDFAMSLDVDDPQLIHCKVRSVIVTYRDQTRYSPIPESPMHTLELMEAPFGPCVIFSDDSSHEHSVTSVHTQCDMMMGSGSTITDMGINGELSAYIQPSTSGVKMRSATGQVVQPAGEGNINLQADKASLVLTC
jgi:hypothetical protein